MYIEIKPFQKLILHTTSRGSGRSRMHCEIRRIHLAKFFFLFVILFIHFGCVECKILCSHDILVTFRAMNGAKNDTLIRNELYATFRLDFYCGSHGSSLKFKRKLTRVCVCARALQLINCEWMR